MKKLTKSEAGKLGAKKSTITSSNKKKIRVDEYNKNPTLCKQCSIPLVYEKRTNKFCTSNCSARYNNINRTRKDNNIIISCAGCEKDIKVSAKHDGSNRYCSNSCQTSSIARVNLAGWLAGGSIPSKKTVKTYLLEEQNNQCSHCGITDWNGKSIVFDLEHKDGNSENNTRENLELICPNCHSQTDTYKGRNVGNGRHSRRQRYADGKSY